MKDKEKTMNPFQRFHWLVIGVIGAFLFLYTAAPCAWGKEWVLEETNNDEQEALVTVKWTFMDKDLLFGQPPSIILQPGESFTFVPEAVPQSGTILNPGPKVFPTDFRQLTFYPDGRISEIRGAVLEETNSFEVGDLRAFLDSFATGQSFLIPDPYLDPLTFTNPNVAVFAGVNLAEYLLDPVLSLPSFVDVVDGRAPELPGYVIGLSPVTLDPDVGYTTAQPLTGRIVFDSNHAIEVVPEPSTLLLLGSGLAGLGGFAWRRQRRK